MKKFILIALMLLVATGYSVLAKYSGGSGSDADPYQIKTTDDLIDLSNHSGDWDLSFILTADITFDADEQSVDWDGDGSADWDADDKKGFSPIGGSWGQKFKGKFKGKGHTISNLYINRPSAILVGLFGCTEEATIENVGIVNCNITGGWYVGGLVGYNYYNSTISNSYSTGTVSGKDFVGGLVGYNYYNSTISNSYSRGKVTRKSGSLTPAFGGFCGYNDATIEYCYSIGSVYYENATDPDDKGFVGTDGGSSTYQHNFFDKDVSNQSSSAGGTAIAKTTSEMKKQSTFPANWTFGQGGSWTMDPDLNGGYPAHQWEDNSDVSVKSFSPENGSENVAVAANLEITFDETVVANQGNITLYKSDGTEIETFNVESSSKLTIAGNKVTINPTSDLDTLTRYYVKIDADFFKDAAGNDYAGIDDNTTWTFVPKFEPIIFKPAEGTAPADIRFIAVPIIDATKTVEFIGFQLASNYEMTQNLTELEDSDAEEKGYILINWNDYNYGNMYYCRYAVTYTDGTEEYGPVSAFIKNESTGVIKIGE